MNKRRIIINRKKQLRSYFSHLWVVSKISRQDFRKNFLLGDLPCGEEDSAYWGMYWGLYDLKGNRKFKLVCSPQDLGVAIKSGERIELEIDDNINGIFVIPVSYTHLCISPVRKVSGTMDFAEMCVTGK